MTGTLSSKPDALTRRWDIYTKDTKPSLVHANHRPIFHNLQLTTWARARRLLDTPITSTPPLNNSSLHHDIQLNLSEDPIATELLGKLPSEGNNHWKLGTNGLLRHHDRLFMFDMGNP